jgi:hypothetical protein
MDNPITKYTIKFVSLTAVILVIFKVMMKKPWFDAILLSMIIVVALICVENIVDMNYTVANPTDCSQCKIPQGVTSLEEGFETTTPATETTTPTSTTTDGKVASPTPQLNQTETQQQIQNKITAGQNLDNEYGQYADSALQKWDDEQVKKANLFRMSIGNPELVTQYLQDGKGFYDKLYKDSTNGMKTGDILNNELAYGDYNYIGPLNAGMINPRMTYIMPSSWYPVPPFAQPCAISANNKSNVTAIINNDGTNNLMSYADLKDFEKTSRMTGSIGMNLEYIKKFLNNPETCN